MLKNSNEETDIILNDCENKITNKKKEIKETFKLNKIKFSDNK